ncbi:ATP-grasp domain-containing protein [Anoxybacterium hadale]|uniref:ATP-grasp domain-containing protein n=1 Tax=Anoxybacterium hadale TaxID=3408580 RepID=A0ACD1AEX6_9FIRM|nr:ATP-grasp domain-containing protein [Clostridiales bacterium]
MSYNFLFCSSGRRNSLLEIFKNEFGRQGEIIACDFSEYSPAMHTAHKRYTVPSINDERYIATILGICMKNNVKGLTTLIDPEIELLSKNQRIFQENGILVFGPSHETAKVCYDKYSTYQHLEKNGIPCVKSYLPSEIRYKIEEFISAGRPLFAKPRCGSGSVGIKKIAPHEALEAELYTDEGYVIQEYMSGEEYDADIYIDMISEEMVSVFCKKKLSMKIGGADKTISVKDERLISLVDQVLLAFDFAGPIDIDFFYQDGEYLVSEINPRFGGGYLHAYGCGVSFPKLILNNMMGKSNPRELFQYEENMVMMMYDSYLIKRLDEINRVVKG